MSKTLHLDFVGNSRRPNKLGWSLLVGGLIFLAVAAANIYPLISLQEQARIDLEKAETSVQAVRVPKKSSMTASERATLNRAVEIKHQLMYPWKSLLTLMETEQQPDVALLVLNPKFPTQQIQITAEAKDTQSMLAYVETLQKSTLLDYPTLATQQLMTRQPGVPIKFQVLAKWKSEKPADDFLEVSNASPSAQATEPLGQPK